MSSIKFEDNGLDEYKITERGHDTGCCVLLRRSLGSYYVHRPHVRAEEWYRQHREELSRLFTEQTGRVLTVD